MMSRLHNPARTHRVRGFRQKQPAPLEQTKYPFADLGLHLLNGFPAYDGLVKPHAVIFGTEHTASMMQQWQWRFPFSAEPKRDHQS
ncbi:MAG: hypothetical protein ACRERU_12020 [Methylococcales bacterium]